MTVTRMCLVVALTGIIAFAGCLPKPGRLGDQLLSRNCAGEGVEPTPIGVLLPLSGKYQWYGEAALAGIQLGAGVLEPAGCPFQGLRLIVRDTGGEPGQAVRQIEDLVVNERVASVIGPMFSDEARAAAAKAQELEVPMIALSGVPEIAQTGSYIFRNFITREAQVKLLVRYAIDDLRVRRFAILHPEDDYGKSFVKLFRDEVERNRGEIVASESYPAETTDFGVMVKKLVGRHQLEARPDFVSARRKIESRYQDQPLQRKRAIEKLVKSIPPLIAFDALFLPDVYDKVAMVAPALAFEDVVLKTESPEVLARIKKSLGRSRLDLVYLLGTEGWNNPKLVEWSGRYVQGAIFSDGFFVNSQRPTTRAFVDKFKEHFQRDPELIAAHGYDHALILKTLIEKNRPCDHAELRDALLNLKDFDGATGNTSFDGNRDAQKKLFLLTIREKEIVELPRPPATSAVLAAGRAALADASLP